jgi:hypothetical protein
MTHAACHLLVSAWASDFADFIPVTATQVTGIRPVRNKCAAPVPLRTQGRCDPFARGFEPSPDTCFASTARVTHRLAAGSTNPRRRVTVALFTRTAPAPVPESWTPEGTRVSQRYRALEGATVLVYTADADLEAIGAASVGDQTPGDRPGDKNSAVLSQSAPEVVIALEGRDSAVEADPSLVWTGRCGVTRPGPCERTGVLTAARRIRTGLRTCCPGIPSPGPGCGPCGGIGRPSP